MGAIEKSLHASTALKTFAIVFGFATAALYVLCDMLGWPLFTYHPATNQIEWFRTPPRKGEGPVMHWYGWTVSAIQGAAALGVLTTLLPDNVTRKFRWRWSDRAGLGDSAPHLFVDAVVDALVARNAGPRMACGEFLSRTEQPLKPRFQNLAGFAHASHA